MICFADGSAYVCFLMTIFDSAADRKETDAPAKRLDITPSVTISILMYLCRKVCSFSIILHLLISSVTIQVFLTVFSFLLVMLTLLCPSLT